MNNALLWYSKIPSLKYKVTSFIRVWFTLTTIQVNRGLYFTRITSYRRLETPSKDLECLVLTPVRNLFLKVHTSFVNKMWNCVIITPMRTTKLSSRFDIKGGEYIYILFDFKLRTKRSITEIQWYCKYVILRDSFSYTWN